MNSMNKNNQINSEKTWKETYKLSEKTISEILKNNIKISSIFISDWILNNFKKIIIDLIINWNQEKINNFINNKKINHFIIISWWWYLLLHLLSFLNDFSNINTNIFKEIFYNKNSDNETEILYIEEFFKKIPDWLKDHFYNNWFILE
jgi:hypothetical protein